MVDDVQQPDFEDLLGEPAPSVRREVEIDASPEEVWEAIATDEERDRWLEDDPDRELTVEPSPIPGRIVWWWRTDPAAAPRRVEVRVVGVPAGARVIVTETAPLSVTPVAPVFPLATLRAAFALVAA
jgi:uncharacterized protein YndB with AHSA1/START domain